MTISTCVHLRTSLSKRAGETHLSRRQIIATSLRVIGTLLRVIATLLRIGATLLRISATLLSVGAMLMRIGATLSRAGTQTKTVLYLRSICVICG